MLDSVFVIWLQCYRALKPSTLELVMPDPIQTRLRRVITEEDLRRLVCPVCRQGLSLDAEAVLCAGCGRRYPVVDGIPALLADRAS
jgi:uncharacterized protein YbaR (Trm112 family)